MRFRVMRVARGKSRSTRVETAEGSRRGSPLLATMTGSTTRGRMPKRSTASATLAMMGALPRAPVLAAWMGRSSAMAAISS
jgi:hypothetical protein